MTQSRRGGWARHLMDQADEQFVSAFRPLASLLTPAPTTGARSSDPRLLARQRLDECFRMLGMQVALGSDEVVVLDPVLREQLEDIRRLWHDLVPGSRPSAGETRTAELLASVDDMRHRLSDLDRRDAGCDDGSSGAEPEPGRVRRRAARAPRP
jgi:hypothetical protein